MLMVLFPGCGAKFKNKSSLFVHKRRHESKMFDVEGKCLVHLLEFFGTKYDVCSLQQQLQ